MCLLFIHAGTITHQAPELLEHGVTSKAADVYSFGVLLWQMLASSRWVLQGQGSGDSRSAGGCRWAS